ncbi:hypothetical protein QR78_24090, partial [Methylobacterium indicum]
MVTPLCDTSILIDILVGREQAVQVRRARWIKLPDAIILASAQVHGLTLVTVHDIEESGGQHAGVPPPFPDDWSVSGRRSGIQ